LDMHLPGYNGIQIYRHIRRNERFAKTLIIVNTADSQMADEIKKELVPTDKVLLKPVDVRELQETAKTAYETYMKNRPAEESSSQIGRLWNKLRPKK